MPFKKTPLEKFWAYIPNMVTLLRMALVLPFIVLIHDVFVYDCAKNWVLMLLFAAILASDIADGFLARRLNCASSAGAKLDIVSDTWYTIFSLAVFAWFKIIPVWFVFVMLAKLLEFIITSKLMRNKQGAARAVFFDVLGKAAVCMVMLLPGIFIFRCVIAGYKTVMHIVIYIVTAMLLASLVNRIARTVRVLKRAPADGNR